MNLYDQLELPPTAEQFCEVLYKECLRIAEESPDTRYETINKACFYTKGISCPRCIVGEAIFRNYPKLYSELEKRENRQDTLIGFELAIQKETHSSIGIQTLVMTIYKDQVCGNYYELIGMIQDEQDSGDCWSECVTAKVDDVN